MQTGYVEAGMVKFFNHKLGRGYVIPDNGGENVFINAATGPYQMFPGVDYPEFDNELLQCFPGRGDRVTFVRGQQKHNAFVAVMWTNEYIYRHMESSIRRRENFRVLRRTCLHGTWGDWREVIAGSAVKLASISARDGQRTSSADQFAPTFWTGTLLTENRFQIWEPGQGFVDYAGDPRPFPYSPKLYRVMLFEKGDSRQLDFGTVEALMWKHPLGAKGDILATTDSRSTHRTIYWECSDRGSANKSWLLCEDPRRPMHQLPAGVELPMSNIPAKASKKVMPVKQGSAPVAMAKSNKPKPTQLKSLDALENLVTNFPQAK